MRISNQIWAGALLVREQRVLLARRTAQRRLYPGLWDLPGGHAKPGEDADRALIRELWEELGVRATIWRPLARVGVPTENGSADYHIFLVEAWEGEPINRQPKEHAQISWFTAEEASALDLADAAYLELFRPAATMISRGHAARPRRP